MKTLIAFAVVLAVTFGMATGSAAKVLSKSHPNVTQLRITLAGPLAGAAKNTAWGVDASYIGPGEIDKLLGVDIYLDDEKRIEAVKITRLSNTGETITMLFTNVLELSIQTLKDGVNRPHKKTPITIHTADGLTFP